MPTRELSAATPAALSQTPAIVDPCEQTQMISDPTTQLQHGRAVEAGIVRWILVRFLARTMRESRDSPCLARTEDREREQT